MRRYIQTKNMAVASLLLFVLAVTGSTLSAQNSPATSASASASASVANAQATRTLNVSGQVVSSDDRPLANAAIVLVSAVEFSKRLYGEFNPDRPLIQTTTDEKGRFHVGFDSTDRRFRTSADLLLYAGSEGHAPEIRNVSMSRIQVDAPLNFQLQKATSVSLTVRSASGDLLQNVSVSPASVHGQHIPWAVARLMAQHQTNNQGVVRLTDGDAESLDGVFVVGEQFGHQRLALRRNADGSAYVQAVETSSIDGQVTSEQIKAIPGISNVRMLVISVPPYRTNFYTQPMQCSWELASIHDDGSFRIPSLALGKLSYSISCSAEFPYRETEPTKRPEFSNASSPTQWNIEFTKQVKLKAKIVDANQEAPLANIHIASYDGRLESTFTDDHGEATFYRVRNHVSYYPHDATGEFFFAEAFYQDSQKVPVNDEISLETIRMVRSSDWQGKVVDSAGSPVAGAKVTYNFAFERFNQSQTCFTDRNGMFRATGIADKTAVELSATHGDLAAAKVSVVVPGKEQFILKLSTVPAASPTGRIVDFDGKPIAGVAVYLRKGVVSQEEKYGPEELSARDLYDDPRTVRSDSEGRFTFPSTIDFREPLQIEIRDPDFFPFVSRFHRVKDNSEGGAAELGEFRIMRRPVSRTVELNVRASSGNAIGDAKIVVAGARVGRIRGITDDTGRLSLKVPIGQAIVAVSAAEHHIHLGELPTEATSLQIDLRSDEQPLQNDGRSVRDIDPAKFAAAATTLFSELQTPDPKASTYHRLATYCNALAAHDPDGFLHFIKTNVLMNTDLLQIALFASQQALTQKPQLVEQAMALKLIPADYLNGMLLTAANATDDPDLQEDWIGEALVSVRGMSGSSRRSAAARFAQILMQSGRGELAKSTTTEMWAESTELQAIVESGIRKEMIGESRTIAPALAMIDLQKAESLIKLTGREVEIPGLVTESWLIFAQANPEEISPQAVESITLNDGGVESWLRRQLQFRRLAANSVPFSDRLATRITSPKTRLQFLLAEAHRTSDQVLQEILLRQAIDAVRQAKMTELTDYFLFHVNDVILQELRQSSHFEAQVFDQIIFNMLWNLPEVFETDRLHTLLGTAAQIVAYKDTHLARTLLEPAIQDRGWLFMGRIFSLSENETLLSVASIKPDWALEIVRELCEAELADAPIEQLELKAGMVQRLHRTERSVLVQ